MKYLIELKFDHAVHFGSSVAGFGVEEVDESCHSDTLFSAIINQIAAVEHLIPNFNLNEFIKEFYSSFTPFRLSSFGIVRGTEYFLPKPLIEPPFFLSDPSIAQYRKDFKRLKWIYLNDFNKWQKKILSSGDIRGYFESYTNELPPKTPSFYKKLTKCQNTQDRETNATQIYHSGELFFYENVYPFFIVDYSSKSLPWNWFVTVLHLLGKSGLGGRRSIGLGKFTLRYDPILIGDDESMWPAEVRENTKHKKAIELWSSVLNHQSASQYLFSLYKPTTISQDDCVSYDLLVRKGWFISNSSFYQMKRKSVFMFSEGSIFKKIQDGELLDISPDSLPEDHHVICRYGQPFTIPFSI